MKLSPTIPRSRRSEAGVILLAVISLILSLLIPVSIARADTAPAAPGEQASVSADPLAAPQIDGVVWSQVVIGNTVYAGGEFTTARPAGSAVGVNTVTRSNLLAYNVTTGALITSFAPTINAQVRTVAASPDGSTLYVGGYFTSVNGQMRNHIAAFSVATGALVPSFAPSANTFVLAIAATASTVYLGGNFTAVGSSPRDRVAAVSVSNGAILPWAPVALDGPVNALAISPDGAKVAAAGGFTTFNGSARPGYGLGMVASGGSGKVGLPFGVNSVVRNGGPHTAFTSLFSDGDTLYGTAYKFGGAGNFEGTFRASWADGSMIWIEDCHGDEYSSFATGSLVYIAGHPHNCANIGGFPEVNPRVAHRALAFTKAVHGTVATNTQAGYSNFGGQPATSLVNWFPDFNSGTFTGQGQGPWSVAGNSQWIVYGGEFTTVNNKPQQGLVRFAVSALAPNKEGPRAAFTVTAQASAPGAVSLSWPTNWDRDNETLTYRVIRNGNAAAPVRVVSAVSRFYSRPTLSILDSGLAASTAYNYLVQVVDPFGNTLSSPSVSVTTQSGTTTNRPPVAAFTSTVAANTASFNGASSSDPDGTVTSFAWSFGDGATAAGITTSHSYANAGTYEVTLTVTDNGGAVNTTSRSVATETPAGTVLASDAFSRTLAGAWGSADRGGPWSISGASAAFSVGPGVATLTTDTAGRDLRATLPTLSTTSVSAVATARLNQAVSGGSVYLSIIGRSVGAADYRARAVVSTTGTVTLQLTRSGSSLVSAVPGITLSPGDQITIRTEIVGSNPTLLRARVWKSGAAEPTAWQVSTTDSTAGLQTVGGVGLGVYFGSGATSLPRTIDFDDFRVVAIN